MPLLPSLLLFSFIIPLLNKISRRHFLSSILHTCNHTLSHPHTYTHILSVTSIYYLPAINPQRSQSAPPIPGCRWHYLALSLKLAPPGHCFLCGIIRVSFSQVDFSPRVGALKKRPITMMTGRRFEDDSETRYLHAFVPGMWEEEK